MEILRIENLSFRYPERKDFALKNVDLSIEQGEFIVVCGESGCGKTTLLKLLKREIAPFGEKSGRIIYSGKDTEALDDRVCAGEIGYVLQNPDSQIVTDKVWHELAFGLENIGTETEVIRRRVGEMASYFGITEWFRKNTDELSGGQKQLLNLASVMVMQPNILILDEPTSQLDPIAAADFIATLQKLNRELGLTIILAEHRLEDVFPIADKVLMMDGGEIILYDTPRNIGTEIGKEHRMVSALPSAVRIFNALKNDGVCPLTVKEGRNFLNKYYSEKGKSYEIAEYSHSKNIAVELKDVWFRYEKNTPDVLRDTRLTVYENEIYCILGGNGSGKTTSLNVISAIDTPYRGKVLINGKNVKEYKDNSLYRNNLAFLPQNPLTVFIKDKVFDDYAELLRLSGTESENEIDKLIEEISVRFDIKTLLDKHPYDLSGGEQQKCAIAKMLLTKPKILLLDEPTKGLDAHSKEIFSGILKKLKKDGLTVVIVTHDVEFAAANGDRCALFFDGEILSADVPEKFFAKNNFYTTAANRMARHLFPNAVTCEQVIGCCRQV